MSELAETIGKAMVLANKLQAKDERARNQKQYVWTFLKHAAEALAMMEGKE